jgi:hypothetical protein
VREPGTRRTRSSEGRGVTAIQMFPRGPRSRTSDSTNGSSSVQYPGRFPVPRGAAASPPFSTPPPSDLPERTGPCQLGALRPRPCLAGSPSSGLFEPAGLRGRGATPIQPDDARPANRPAGTVSFPLRIRGATAAIPSRPAMAHIERIEPPRRHNSTPSPTAGLWSHSPNPNPSGRSSHAPVSAPGHRDPHDPGMVLRSRAT